jgi:Arc/MetJ family transcription regulator
MQFLRLFSTLASLLASSSALDLLRKQPLSSSDKQAVGQALTKALNAMQNHGGSKWEACADMFPDGKPPADQNSATWVSCKSVFYGYAASSLIQDPISTRDKKAVGEALTKALNAMQNHGGSKWAACADMFPNGQPPADQNSPTWISCKGQFLNYAAASLLQGPLSSSDKQAVGAALTKALKAMQGHAGGSKYEACADMFPDGKPPADQNSPTWAACKSTFYAYAASALLNTKSVGSKGKHASLLADSSSLKGPLSSSDKKAVGEALTKALQAMQNHAGGSKFSACADMFPDGKPPADQNSATWVACRDQFYAYAAASLVQRPLTSSDKQAVGEALTKALGAMQNHAGGSKYEACAGMFPNGKPPADQNSPTWAACKGQFYASLVGTVSSISKGPPPVGVHSPHNAGPHRSSAIHAFPVVTLVAMTLAL